MSFYLPGVVSAAGEVLQDPASAAGGQPVARDHRGRALQPQVPQRDDGEDGRQAGTVEVCGGVPAHHQGLETDAVQEGEAGCVERCLRSG